MSSYRKELRETLARHATSEPNNGTYQVPSNPARFFEILEFKPTTNQKKLLHHESKFVVVHWLYCLFLIRDMQSLRGRDLYTDEQWSPELGHTEGISIV